MTPLSVGSVIQELLRLELILDFWLLVATELFDDEAAPRGNAVPGVCGVTGVEAPDMLVAL